MILGEVGKLLGERWKGLNEKQKAPYEAKAAADKKRYEEEKAAYTAVSLLVSRFREPIADNICRAALTTMKRRRTKRSLHPLISRVPSPQ